MELSERLNFCRKCNNQHMDMHRGLLCGLTNNKPDFEGTCANYDDTVIIMGNPDDEEHEYEAALPKPCGELYESILKRFYYELPIAGGRGSSKEQAIIILEAGSANLTNYVIDLILIMRFNAQYIWWEKSAKLEKDGDKTYYIPHIVCFKYDNNGNADLNEVIAEEEFYFDVTIPVQHGDVFDVPENIGSGVLHDQILDKLKVECPISGGDGHSKEEPIDLMIKEPDKRDELMNQVISHIMHLKFPELHVGYYITKQSYEWNRVEVIEIEYYKYNWRGVLDTENPIDCDKLYFKI